MRFLTSLTVALCAAANFGQSSSLFSNEERTAVLHYWSQPGRYSVSLPDDALTAGVWQVRLTVAGSQWLWNYQKGKKVPPTQNPAPQTEQQVEWEKWIQAKLARDRWEALQSAQNANEKLLGKRLPLSDKTLPAEEPPLPGPIPAELLAECGDAPRFAEAVAPMQHTIGFDDGSLTYRDNTRLSNPRYAFYRSEKGVMSMGTPAKELAESRIDALGQQAGIAASDMRVMKAVSMLEGGFDSVNTYDTGFVSAGFIQFASLSAGGGSLGAMLLTFKKQFPAEFQSSFRHYGIDVTTDGLLDAMDLSTGAELIGPDANKAIIEDKRLIAVFQHAGLKSDAFVCAQIRAAHDMFYPASDAVTLQVGDRSITGAVSDFVKSEAGLAVLMDRKVNTGKLDPLVTMITELANEIQIQSLSDLAPYEHDIVAAVRYRHDYLADPSLSQPKPSPSSRWASQMSRGSQGRTGRGGHH
jgi:hypothetical protein